MADNQRQKATFTIVDGPDFPVTEEVGKMLTTDIARHINASFKRIFADYYGCTIQCDITQYPYGAEMLSLDANHPVQLTLYFSPTDAKATSDGRFVAFRPIETKDQQFTGHSYIAPISNRQSQMRQNRASVATQEAIDIFHDLLWGEIYARTTRNPSMKEFIDKGVFAETTMDPNGGNQGRGYMNVGQSVFAVVNYVDINKVWKRCWKDTEKGDEFRTRPVKPALSVDDYVRHVTMDQQRSIPMNIPGYADPVYITKTDMPYIIEIAKLKGKAVKDMYESISGNRGGAIYTDAY